jgi:hypothetical protein
VKGLERSDSVWQAISIISVESACTMIEAEDKLRVRAAADGQPVERVAVDVLKRRRPFKWGATA